MLALSPNLTGSPALQIAHLTDLHIRPPGVPAYRVVESNMMLERALAAVKALTPQPDALILSGDLTDCGLPEEYALLRRLLEGAGMPVYLIPGNHDRREALREAFAGWPTLGDDPEFIDFAADIGPLRVIGLDSVVPGSGHGALCDRRLRRLEAALAAAPETPTLIFLHHPPFACGIRHMDAIRLLDGADQLARIVTAHPQVERVLSGHHHRPIQVRWAGSIAQIAPSVAHQVEFRLEPDAEPAFVLEPPAFLVHAWIDGTGLVSHQVYVERHPGPFPFVLDPDYPGGG